MGVKSSQRMYLVKVNGIDGYFQTKTGGNIAAETSKVYDGGSLKPDIVAGIPDAEDVTVSRAFEAARDGALLKQLKQRVGSWFTTVSVQPTDATFVAIGDPTVYANALLKGVNESDVDSSSGDAANYELVFAVGSYT